MFFIEISDGVNRQVKKLKDSTSKDRALQILQRLADNDESFYIYSLLDEFDNEIACIDRQEEYYNIFAQIDCQ